ncbi:lambda exonuclease family protein [Novosphingobium sp. KN65.2]|uniref:lambda exonuclease family protein n=1 Tax=Novosphingobium sp. KN65.2 TaxID=1478134 RepID=UPI0005DE9F03|nr:lambda exonuclease family protein [Novosphingobium sp. KN65.2]CDO38950.1 YqaJ viral recombinase family protein [Novosphingobium sp. KN65.2]
MTIKYHDDLIQGSEEWLAARCGILSASEVKLIMTPTLKVANNDKTRAHVFELLFQRITGFVEPQYVSDAMLRGQEDEIYAREAYREHFAEVTETGFVTNDSLGFTIGYSPDGLVGDDGLIEIKSRCGKYHVQTIAQDEVPEEYMLQLQTGLFVTGREWIDFISYCGGLPMFVKRVEPIPEFQEAIISAATAFEARIADMELEYFSTLAAMKKVIPTERREALEIVL